MNKITKVGILLPHLHNNQLGYEITSQLNKLTITHPYIDSVVFTEEDRPQTLLPKFAIMNISEVYDQQGLLIATTPNTAGKLVHCWGTNLKAFYSYDCFWMRGTRNKYEALLNLYQNKEFDVIARSESHKRLIENNFNIHIDYVVDKFNILDFITIYEAKLNKKQQEEEILCQN